MSTDRAHAHALSFDDVPYSGLIVPEATVKTRNLRDRNLLRTDFEERFEPAVREAFLFLGDRCDRAVARVIERLQETGAMRACRRAPLFPTSAKRNTVRSSQRQQLVTGRNGVACT